MQMSGKIKSEGERERGKRAGGIEAETSCNYLDSRGIRKLQSQYIVRANKSENVQLSISILFNLKKK